MSNYQAVTVSTKINGEDISLRVTPIGQYHNLFTSTIANVFRRHGSSSVEVEGDIGGHLELCWGSTDPKQGHSFTHLPIVGYDSTGGLIPGVITLGRVAPINLTSTKAGALGEDLADMLSNPFEYTGQVWFGEITVRAEYGGHIERTTYNLGPGVIVEPEPVKPEATAEEETPTEKPAKEKIGMSKQFTIEQLKAIAAEIRKKEDSKPISRQEVAFFDLIAHLTEVALGYYKNEPLPQS